jgi:DNA-binding NtrC family response regulator
MVNVAFLRLQLGDLGPAEEAFLQVAPELTAHPTLALALFDNMCELRILQGRLHDAREEFEKARRLLSAQIGLENTWQSLAQVETETRLLIREGDLTGAEQLARSAAVLAESRNDELLAARFRTLTADVMLRSGRSRAANEVLARVVPFSERLPLVALGELERVLGCYFSTDGQNELAGDSLNRATRILSVIGSASAKLDLQTTLTETIRDAETHGSVLGESASRPRVEKERRHGSVVVWPLGDCAIHAPSVIAVAHLFRLADRKDLLLSEVISLISRISHSRIKAKLVRRAGEHGEPSKGTQVRSPSSDIQVRVSVGASSGEPHDVLLRAEPAADAAKLCVALKELIEGAVLAASVRRDSRLRESLWAFEPGVPEGPGVVGSAAMREVVSTVSRIAPSDLPVLLTGETGTGKELLAREVHRRSRLAAGPFMPFNCSAVPRDMLASQLFGYRRGAFTGAVDNFPGIIRAAASGTLFLDEIGELSLEAQPKLLRFLESSEIHPLGELQPIRVNVRVVAATNVHLEKLMQEGRFREDLYYRLNVARIHLPPLRERREEIPALVDFYLDKYSQESRRARLRVSDEALEFLMLYNWPGNIRQLANEIRRIVAFAEPGSMLVPSMLAPEIQASRRTIDASQPVVGPNEMVVRIDQPLDAAVAELERAMIERALADSHGHLETAAERLGISRKGLFLKRRRLGLAN